MLMLFIHFPGGGTDEWETEQVLVSSAGAVLMHIKAWRQKKQEEKKKNLQAL